MFTFGKKTLKTLVTASLIKVVVVETDLYVSLQTVISIYNPAPATLSIVKRVYRTVRL